MNYFQNYDKSILCRKRFDIRTTDLKVFIKNELPLILFLFTNVIFYIFMYVLWSPVKHSLVYFTMFNLYNLMS